MKKWLVLWTVAILATVWIGYWYYSNNVGTDKSSKTSVSSSKTDIKPKVAKNVVKPVQKTYISNEWKKVIIRKDSVLTYNITGSLIVSKDLTNTVNWRWEFSLTIDEWELDNLNNNYYVNIRKYSFIGKDYDENWQPTGDWDTITGGGLLLISNGNTRYINAPQSVIDSILKLPPKGKKTIKLKLNYPNTNDLGVKLNPVISDIHNAFNYVSILNWLKKEWYPYKLVTEDYFKNFLSPVSENTYKVNPDLVCWAAGYINYIKKATAAFEEGDFTKTIDFAPAYKQGYTECSKLFYEWKNGKDVPIFTLTKKDWYDIYTYKDDVYNNLVTVKYKNWLLEEINLVNTKNTDSDYIKFVREGLSYKLDAKLSPVIIKWVFKSSGISIDVYDVTGKQKMWWLEVNKKEFKLDVIAWVFNLNILANNDNFVIKVQSMDGTDIDLTGKRKNNKLVSLTGKIYIPKFVQIKFSTDKMWVIRGKWIITDWTKSGTFIFASAYSPKQDRLQVKLKNDHLAQLWNVVWQQWKKSSLIEINIYFKENVARINYLNYQLFIQGKKTKDLYSINAKLSQIDGKKNKNLLVLTAVVNKSHPAKDIIIDTADYKESNNVALADVVTSYMYMLHYYLDPANYKYNRNLWNILDYYLSNIRLLPISLTVKSDSIYRAHYKTNYDKELKYSTER